MKIIYFTKVLVVCYLIFIPKTALSFIGRFGSTPCMPVSVLSSEHNTLVSFSFLLEKRLEFRALGAFFLPKNKVLLFISVISFIHLCSTFLCDMILTLNI